MDEFEGVKVVRFRVDGVPKTQGSMKVVPNRKTGRPILIADNRPELLAWRERVAAAAPCQHDCYKCAVEATFTFWLERPKNHWRVIGGKLSRRVKESADIRHVTKPDVDKLIRAVLDGLTGICFTDDSQVVSVRAAKLYESRERKPGLDVELRLWP